MMTDLNDVGQPMHHGNREDLAIPDFANGLKEIDERLFQPKILQARFGARACRRAHFARLNDLRNRFPDRRTTANLKVFDSAEVDFLEQFEKATFWVG
jgi:hypothetical protein